MRLLTSRFGWVALAAVLAMTAPASAQTPNETPAAKLTRPGNRFADRVAQREWTRGFYAGFDRGYWVGVHDARAGWPPLNPYHFRDNTGRITPFRDGYLQGLGAGYRRGYWQRL